MGNPYLAEKWFRESLRPEPILTVSEWADLHRYLSPRASSEAGKWRTARTPYLKEIMDVLSPSNPCKKIIFKKASQVGATECGNNWIGFIMDHSPGPVMLVQPTGDLAKRNSKLRIEPLIEDCPRIKERVEGSKLKKKKKDTSHTILQKDFEGGTLVMTGANSAAGLRSMPARFLMLDEVDAYPRDLDGEGDPIALVMARSRTFSRRKAFLISTPTLDGISKIDEEYKESDQREFHVPCPHCSKFQTLKFKMLQWPDKQPKAATYFCEHCGEEIKEHKKTKMLALGKWIAANPGHDNIGFFLNSLYSPLGWYSWADIAKDYDEAKRELENEKKTEKMRTFTNTVLGETYKESGEAPDWKRLYYRREDYEIGSCPKDVLFITCGVDLQKDRIECEVVGWGKQKQSWSLEYQIFQGDPAGEKVWKELELYLGKTFENEEGKQLPIKLTAIDSGFQTQHVYNFVRRFPSNRVVAVKGSDGLSMIVGFPKIVDAKLHGKVYKRGVKVWTIGVSLLKSELYGWLKLDPPIGEEKFPPGFCHFPEYDEEYFKQMTAEKVMIKRNRKGFSAVEWVKERERNEALDCRIYNRAAASMLGIDRMREKDLSKFETAPIAKPIQVKDNLGTEVVKPKKVKSPRPESSFW
jgi:phage terminase large subunit GpA-like protein